MKAGQGRRIRDLEVSFRWCQCFPAECQALSYAASLKIKAPNFCSENTGLTDYDAGQAHRLQAVPVFCWRCHLLLNLSVSVLLFQNV